MGISWKLAVATSSLGMLAPTPAPAQTFRPTHLTIDYRPAGSHLVVEDTLRLGWAATGAKGVRQNTYRVQVARDSGFAEAELAFDTHEVPSGASQNVRLAPALPAGRKFYWRVRLRDDARATSAWSRAYAFFTAPEWRAPWIATRAHEVSDARPAMGTWGQVGRLNPQDSAAAYLARDLVLPTAPTSAHVYVTGLGYYVLHVNGARVGRQVLDPAFSDYQRSVYYSAYDVTDHLRAGGNRLGATLGNGFYNLYTHNLFQLDQSAWKGPHELRLELHLTYPDGRREVVGTDERWRWGHGPIAFNSIMGGETFDARRAVRYDSAVVVAAGPGGVMRPQVIPGMAVARRLSPKHVTRLDDSTQLLDFGENLTGVVALAIPAMAAGRVVRVEYNEVLDSLGRLDTAHSRSHTRGRFQEDRYISDGAPGRLHNSFSYFGFRYAQVTGYPRDIRPTDAEALDIHTALEGEGTFTSSSERLGQLQAAIARTLRNSIHGMPGEEPTREKMGWTLDAGLNTMEPYLYLFNAVAPFEKYLRDLGESADTATGHIPPIVPTNGWGRLGPDGAPILYDDPWWGGTTRYVVDELVRWTGDSTYYRDYYPALRGFTDFVRSRADSHLIVHYSLGDWLDPENWAGGWGPGLTSVEVTSTLGLYDLAASTARIGAALGHTREAVRYAALADSVVAGFAERLYNDTEINPTRSQTGHAVPLWLGAFDERPDLRDSAYARLLRAVDAADGHIYSGFIGIKPILETLADRGEGQRAVDMILEEGSPGWMQMVADEYSTMGENVNAEGYGTGHHPFGTNVGYWAYKHILGARPLANGWQTMLITPELPAQLTRAGGTVPTPYGAVAVAMERRGDGIHYRLTVPFNTEARFRPDGVATSVLPKGYPLDEAGRLVLPAGEYEFTLPNTKTR